MNVKRKKMKILSLMTLTVVLGALSSRGLASGEWMQEAPTRLGQGQVASIAFSPDGTILYAAHRTDSSGQFYEAQTVIYWDPETKEQVGALPHHLVSNITLSPDGNILVTATEPGKTIHLWDVAGQSQIGQIQPPRYQSNFAFSPDGKILASSGYWKLDGMIHLWDVQTQQQIATITRDQGNGLQLGGRLAFSPDGRTLVVGGDHNGNHHITLWDLETLNQVGELIGHLDTTTDLAFNPNGTILASAGAWEDKAVYLWYVQTQELVGVLGGHSAHVGSIDFSPDGTLLASTSFWDDSIYLWDVKGRVLVGKLNGHDATDFGWNDQVDISSDGKWLACGSENGVELWEANFPGAVPQTSAYGPLPRDGAIHDKTWVTLSWQPGIDAVSHDVYMGDNFDDVNEGIDEVYHGNQTGTFFLAGVPGYAYSEGLVPGTTYYWRIDEVNQVNPDSPWKGPVWSFTASGDGQSIQPFDANPNRDTATYTVTFSGDLVGSFERENMPVYEDRIEHMPVQEPLDLHDFFAQKIGQAEADLCFPYPSRGLHGIDPIQKHPERGAIISLFFDGFDHDGKALKYRLDLTGYFADLSNWTPAPGTTSDVILTNWEVQSDTKGGRNKACRAEGTLSATVEVYRAP